MSGNQAPLNPDALASMARIHFESGRTDHRKWEHLYPEIQDTLIAEMRPYAEAVLAVAQPVVTGEQVNRAGWTCDGIHEPGSYTTCEDCRGACDDLANFYNQMRSTPNASGPWTYRPEVKP